MSTWFLAIDFGTTNTCAAVVTDEGPAPVRFGPSQVEQMPSAVLLRPDGTLVVGFDAQIQASLHPDRYEPAPKRSVGQASLLLGDREIAVVEVVAAVLSVAAREARRQQGGFPPSKTCLTYPARWGTSRLSVLRDAATRAGLGDVVLVSEPEAAALYFAKHDRVPIGRSVAVYDLGGGTLDVAVLAATPSGFRLIGRAGGIDPLGGDDVDDRLLTLTLDRAPRDLVGVDELRSAQDRLWQARRTELQREVRRAKEDLALVEKSELLIPGLGLTAELTREDLRMAAADDIEASLNEFARTVELAGLNTNELARIYLAGGSSKLLLVREGLSRRLAPETLRTVRTLSNPKAAVALGAAEYLHEGETEPPLTSESGLFVKPNPRGRLTWKHAAAGVLVLTLLLVAGVVWFNLRETNVVWGTLYNGNNEPMPNIELKLTSGFMGEHIDTKTDGGGRFSGSLPQGSYAINAYGTVPFDGRGVQVELAFCDPGSGVVDLPANGGANLDLCLWTSGQMADKTGVSHTDYYGGIVQFTEWFSMDDARVVPLSQLRKDLEVSVHFEPEGPLIDGGESKAFDVTRTVEELLSGRATLNHDSIIYNIALGSYVVSAFLQGPSGPIPLVVQDTYLNTGHSVTVSPAGFCQYGCGKSGSSTVMIAVGIEAVHLG